MVAHGLQRLDGRVWKSNYRGPLWIHAAAKEPTHDDISFMQEFHADVFRALADTQCDPALPSSYPTSCLLGCVDLVDCVSAADFSAWPTLPAAAHEEASIHGSGFFLLFENHRRLVLPQHMPGQHK